MRRILMLSLVAATLALAGCPKPVKDTAPTDTNAGSSSTDTGGTNPGEVEEGTQNLPGESEADRLAQNERVVYFDYDSYEISSQYGAMIAAHARKLSSTTAAKVRLEGHTDERGSREYNIGLGEKRAQAVRRALMLQGAGDAQIVTVSYGEERPAQAGGDEAAWAKNRRVEIVYGN